MADQGTAVATRDNSRVGVFQAQLQSRAREIQAALPAHITPDKFQRTVLTAVAKDPDLLKADRQSLVLACYMAAQDGLLPDGREAALVIFSTRKKVEGQGWQTIKQVQYMPMVYGLRKKILQSGDVVALEVDVVYKIEAENGYFRYEKGTEPPLNHAPMLDIPDDEATDGKIVAAYSIATMRDGTKSYELMRRADINKVRQMSQTGAIGRIAKYDMGDIKKGQEIPPKGPWVDWFGEMAKKTVMRRHSKTLPMSGDVLIDVEGRELERNASSAFALGSTAPDAAELLTDDTGTHYDPATGEVHDEPEQDERRDDQPAQVNDQAEPSTDTPELFNNDDGEARQKQEEEANRLIGEMSEARNVVTLKKVYDGNELEIASLPDDLASDVESSYDRNLKRFGTTRVKVAKVIAEANAEAASAK